ncbi:MAG: ROK family protein [Lewinellaceae bacterium]|nr:ROK family protein [Lewinellaceae bacterium]HPQ99553.1 ROK family protein [Saprospiraceae bacterium]
MYKEQIIKQLYYSDRLSCTDLSRLIHKSIPFTSATVNELIEENVLIEEGLATSTGGRKPHVFSLKPDYFYIFAIAINQLNTRMAIYDLTGNSIVPIQSISIPLPGNPGALETITEYAKQMLLSSNIDTSKVLAAGVGMPGFINLKKGINHSFLKVKSGNIIQYMESVLGIPVIIDNDSSLVALAELRKGLARGKKNALAINIGWGVGLGILLNGELFRGENGYAGEFSHMALFNNNKVCSCGKIGCLETETSINVLLDKAKEGIANGKFTTLPNPLPAEKIVAVQEIFNAMAQGDQFSIGLLSEIGYNIGRGISILIHLLNPSLIILSGIGAGAGKLWLAPIQQAVNELSIPKLAENTEIKISELAGDAELVGAGTLVIDHLENFDLNKVQLMMKE